MTRIYTDAPRDGVRLHCGCDDFAKVYLNGKPIYDSRRTRAFNPAANEVRIDLKKGKNVLICKVIERTGHWGVLAQIVGDDYQPIPGVTTGLEP